MPEKRHHPLAYENVSFDGSEKRHHPLAYENVSFDGSEIETPEERVVHPVVNVDEVYSRCNVQDWSLEDLLMEEKKFRVREYSWLLNDHNQIFGAEEVIHLPRKLSVINVLRFVCEKGKGAGIELAI